MKRILRLVVFLCLLPFIYIATTFLLSNLQYSGHSILSVITGNHLEPGRDGQTLRRFREIEKINKVDLLFVGSSHVYRGFDTRIFAQGGYSSFNMGNIGQTPLNSYYLLKKYLDTLHPKLVIFEVSPNLLSIEGIESYMDLVCNLPISREMLEMTLALNSPCAIIGLVTTALTRVNRPLSSMMQMENENEVYVTGGYCETFLKSSTKPVRQNNMNLLAIQLEYLDKMISYAKSRHSDVILVTQPTPEDSFGSRSQYQAFRREIAHVAKRLQVEYIDYSNKLNFKSGTDFFDNDHLTPSGVHKYNTVVLRDIDAHFGGGSVDKFKMIR